MLILFETILSCYMLDVREILLCRLICVDWNSSINFLIFQCKEFPVKCSDYMNINGLINLFPNVSSFGNLGHRGEILDREVMCKVSKLWLDSPLSSFSIIMFHISMVSIKHLVLNLKGKSFDLLNVISRIEWPSLECLCIISESIDDNNLNPSNWKMKKINSLMLGSKTSGLPLYFRYLPKNTIEELSVMNGDVYFLNFEMWFSYFIKVWVYIQSMYSLRVLRLYYIIDESEICLSTMVQAINLTRISEVFLVPCSLKSAVFILNHTNIKLTTEIQNCRVRWLVLKNVFGPRLNILNF